MCSICNGTAVASFSCCHHESILVPPWVSSITGLPLFKSIASSSGWTTLCQFCVLFLQLKMYRNSLSAQNKSFTSFDNRYLGHTKVTYNNIIIPCLGLLYLVIFSNKKIHFRIPVIGDPRLNVNILALQAAFNRKWMDASQIH